MREPEAWEPQITEEAFEALNMAIAALFGKDTDVPSKDDLISRADAIRWVKTECNPYGKPTLDFESGIKVIGHLEQMRSAQTEPTRIISETRAIPSDDDRVSLSETVTATYYDEENEEWSRKIVTVRDVLDSVCDEYTVLPSAQSEIIRCSECKYYKPVTAQCEIRGKDCISSVD